MAVTKNILQGITTCGLLCLISSLCTELHSTFSALAVLLKSEAQTVKQGELTAVFDGCSIRLSSHSFRDCK